MTRGSVQAYTQGYFLPLREVIQGKGIPLALLLTGAQVHNSRAAWPTLQRLQVRRRRRPQGLTADKGYDSRPLRRQLRRHGIRASIPEQRYGHQRAQLSDEEQGVATATSSLWGSRQWRTKVTA